MGAGNSSKLISISMQPYSATWFRGNPLLIVIDFPEKVGHWNKGEFHMDEASVVGLELWPIHLDSGD